MGTLLGHVVPGTFFIIFPIWWGFSLPIKYYQIYHSRQVLIYRSTTTFPCICGLTTGRISMESSLKFFCAIIGILGEFLTGFTYSYNETFQRSTWTFSENNSQHITMFFAFALASFIEILVHRKYLLLDGVEFLANIIAFGIEGFLFHFHLHGRDPIDIHVHTLLVYAIIICLLTAIWEYNRPHQIMATYARTAATLLQGVW